MSVDGVKNTGASAMLGLGGGLEGAALERSIQVQGGGQKRTRSGRDLFTGALIGTPATTYT